MRRALLLLILSALAAPATASAACEDRYAEPVFSRWGDEADYFAAPGGLFAGALEWTATGSASLAEAANPFAAAEDDVTSLALAGATSVTSPPICIQRWHPYLRYAARAEGKVKPRLGLTVLYQDDKGKPKRVPISDLDPKRYYVRALTSPINLRKVLPREDHVRTIQLQFVVGAGAGEWLVDSVFVDPVKKG